MSESSTDAAVTEKEDKKLITDGGKNGSALKSGKVDKAWNRMISEGYKYHALDGSLSSQESDNNGDSVKKKSAEYQQRHRQFLCLLVISIVIIAMLTSIVIWQYVHKGTSGQQESECKTASCVQTSAYILQKMDLAVDPCQDFYSYACGNWERTTTIPESKSKYGTFQIIADQITVKLRKIFSSDSVLHKGHNSTSIWKMKTYYNTCMDVDTVEKLDVQPLIDLINDFGGWTVGNLSTTWDNNTWNLMDSLVKIQKTGLNSPFLSMIVSNDDRNSSVNIIMLAQSGLTLSSHEQYFTNDTKYQKLKDAYIEFGTNWGVYMGAVKADARTKIEAVYNFEQQLAYIFRSKEELQDPTKIYNKMSIRDLQDKYVGEDSMLNIHEYLNKILGYTLTDDRQIIVYTPDYLRELTPILAKTPRNVLADYMVWSSINLMAGYLPKRFTDLALEMGKVETGVAKLEPLWKRCMHKAVSTVSNAAGALYVQDYFADTSKEQVENILEQIRSAFIENLPSVTWMDAPTRDKAIEKAKAVTKKIAYPDWILDPIKLDMYYENLTVISGKFVESLFHILHYSLQKNLNRLHKPPDPTEWDMAPTEVNAYYTPTYNEMVFPAGILQQPFYDPEFPMSFNFGTVGMIIGHELTHGFDSSGRKYDLHGNLNNWWTNSSIGGFKAETGCMIKQYSGYEVDHLGIHIRGETTLGENIADNGGLKTAFHAYRKWKHNHDGMRYPGLDLDDDQLFFVGFSQLWCSFYTKAYAEVSVMTDEHTYAKYRVIGTLSNSNAFARTFHCPLNSPMNPAHKCVVW